MNRVHRSVIILGLVSFFTDVSSEMIYPLLPLFLSTTLGATPAAVGLIEGVAELIAAWTKLLSGKFSDAAKSKKKIILLGYGISGFVRPLVGLAASWPIVMLIRSTDRIGKGIRSSPRDALIADVTHEDHRGRAYGFHRSMDHWGAVTGPLLAAGLMAFFQFSMSTVFLLAIIPASISFLILYFGLKEETTASLQSSLLPSSSALQLFNFKKDWRESSGKLKFYLLTVFIFSLGQSSDAFLLMKLSQAGIEAKFLPILWAGLHVVKATSSNHFGSLSDKIGHRSTILMGWGYYAIILYLIGILDHLPLQILAFLAYGIFFGLTEGPEKALLSLLAKTHQRGTVFGYYNLLLGTAILPASLIFGILWERYSAQTAFSFSIGASAIACVLLILNPVERKKA